MWTKHCFQVSQCCGCSLLYQCRMYKYRAVCMLLEYSAQMIGSIALKWHALSILSLSYCIDKHEEIKIVEEVQEA